MKFIADLHVHSKYSRATSKSLDLENLHRAAQLKGITVVGTGDCTHPAWFEEISQKLVPAEPGLFRLRDDLAQACDEYVPAACRAPVFFMLTAEISNIYKKEGRTRKNHNLVLLPNLADAARFRARLEKVGNLSSDGRPILGLDARHLLELLLETSQPSFLIPAHVWTPWFSVLGSKSGFDSIQACFEDLTSHIFALETGLSSDPPMNWRVSSLDQFTLVSNSDAHSPLNLGRESNLFDTDLSFFGIRDALESGNPQRFLGTLEFYPEEGKYHFDGHRNCNVCLNPEQTLAYHGICPVCRKPLTLGVLYRVEELADRRPGEKTAGRHPYFSVISLTGILTEIFQAGAGSQKVRQAYQTLVAKLGPEFRILRELDRTQLETSGVPLLDEAVMRMRDGRIRIQPGYDGEFGRVAIFDAHERKQLMGQRSLFAVPSCESMPDRLPSNPVQAQSAQATKAPRSDNAIGFEFASIGNDSDFLSQLNEQQRAAVTQPRGPLVIVAGPGTGKTRTLTVRIAYHILKKNIVPNHILAVTFTNKAAQEMRARLQTLVGSLAEQPLVTTFHALAYRILNQLDDSRTQHILEDGDRLALVAEALRLVKLTGVKVVEKAHRLMERIGWAKIHLQTPEPAGAPDGLCEVYRTYQQLLRIQGLYDYEDLISEVVHVFESVPELCQRYQQQFQHVFVDEYQDLNYAQYRFITALAPPNRSETDICVIGDPDQSIYGFRGSDPSYVSRFLHDYPKAQVVRLTRNYRSSETILQASFQVIRNHRLDAGATRVYSNIDGSKAIHILQCEDENREAGTIAREIQTLVGGTGFHSVDTGLVRHVNSSRANSYADFAVLARTADQHRAVMNAFNQIGIPHQLVSRENAFNRRGIQELVSFVKLIEGSGSYLDHARSLLFFDPKIGKTAIGRFQRWSYHHGLSLPEALRRVVRFAVPELSRAHQRRLNQFSTTLLQLQEATVDMSVSQKLAFLMEQTQFRVRFEADAAARDAWNWMMEMAQHADRDVMTFLSTISVGTDTDLYSGRAEKVLLMTMHAAKGLEFPVVFIAGCEEGLVPYQRPEEEAVDLEEERRLFYVAMTRAMDRLYLTSTRKRRLYGRTQKRLLSPFVADIEDRLKSVQSAESEPRPEKAAALQLALFE